jgi:hypothetical protein
MIHTSLMAIDLSSEFTNKQKQQINACRIYLQTISSLDISTFDGNSITQHAHDGKERIPYHRLGGQINKDHLNPCGIHGEISSWYSSMTTSFYSNLSATGDYINNVYDP